MSKWMVLLLVGVALAGCATPNPVEGSMDRIATGDLSGHHFNTTAPNIAGVIVTSQSQWEDFWMKHDPTSEAVPEIDFSKRFVAALFLGDRPTGGYLIGVNGLEFIDDTYVLAYRTGEPGPGCMVEQTTTQPYDLVAIDRVHGAGNPQVQTVLDDHIIGDCEGMEPPGSA